jgi:uncharacterized membrane protein
VSLFPGHSGPHIANIVVHVACGTIALLAGMAALMAAKGALAHRRVGRIFLYAITVVIATAAIGRLAFDFRTFLALVTLLSFYQALSGMRALRLRGSRARAVDRGLAAFGLISPIVFLVVIRRMQRPWSPMLTYSILGTLVGVGVYDLLREVLPAAWLGRVWRQEHLVKMIGAYIAISSAFAGTVFPGLMPWAAIIPSCAGMTLSITFLARGPRQWLRHETTTGPTAVAQQI